MYPTFMAKRYKPLSEGNKLDWWLFNFGTIVGLYRENDSTKSLQFLSIKNQQKGNGNFDLFFEYLRTYCSLKEMNLEILSIENDRLLNHLLNKRGFEITQNLDSIYNVIKYFNKK